MTKHPSYRARDQPESGSASQHRKDKIMHKFEKRDAKSRTLVILAVVGLAAALTLAFSLPFGCSASLLHPRTIPRRALFTMIPQLKAAGITFRPKKLRKN